MAPLITSFPRRRESRRYGIEAGLPVGQQKTVTIIDDDPTPTFPVGTNPASVAIGDLNGDGKPDLATANRNSNNVSILINK